MRRKRTPLRKRGARGAYGGVDIRGRTLGDGCQVLSIGRIDCVEIFSCSRRLPGTVDEVSEAIAVAVKPGLRLFRIFGGGAVLHRQKLFSDAHVGCSISLSADKHVCQLCNGMTIVR